MAIVHSRIDQVTVYRTGATITRRLELEGDQGLPEQVEIGALPLSLLDPTASVRVVEVEPAEAIVATSSVRVGMRAHAEDSAPEEGDCQRLKALEREQMLATAQLRQLELEQQLLQSMDVPMRPSAEEGTPPYASPIGARVALERFSDKAISQRLEQARELRRRLRQLERDAAELRDRVQRSSSAREAKPHQLFKTVIAQLEQRGEPARRATLLVEYQVPGARWAPAYQLDVGRDGAEADLALRAVVAQETGEDWHGVHLSLSTAEVLTWSEMPELAAIRIGRAQQLPRPRRGFKPPPHGAGSLFADHDAGRSAARQLLPPAPGWREPVLTPVAPELFDELEDEIGFCGDSSTPVGERTAQMLMPSAVNLAAGVASFSPATRSEGLASDEQSPTGGPMPMASALGAPAPPAQDFTPRRRRPSAEVTRPVQVLISETPHPISLTLLFSQLQLGSPEVRSARSRLMPCDARANYMETLQSDNVEVELDVMNIISDARQRAESVASPSLFPTENDRGAFDYRYTADALVDIDGDGLLHTVGLYSRAAVSEMRYVTVPREERAVYRSARLENPLDSPLLPGPVEVYVGGQYVLSAELPLVGPKGHFELGLGVEQALKVARNTHYNELRSGEKVVAMTELEHTIDIELINHLGREVCCEVRECIPQPDVGAEVVVEERRVDPPWEPYDQRDQGEEVSGGRRWLLELGAHEEKKLHATYVVKIYANNELVGGNRREV
ncbi:MAG: DUF4139 domain-containing protein [Deltaproteobacteria bacterium]|nr:DUF4139 domain-containing protein [Deltaproteobacteria bacterium]